MRRRKIAVNYLKTYFVVDLVSLLPFGESHAIPQASSCVPVPAVASLALPQGWLCRLRCVADLQTSCWTTTMKACVWLAWPE